MRDRKRDNDDEDDDDDERKNGKRSGGVDIDSSDVDVEGDIVGRDKIVQSPPRKEEDIRSKISNSIWNAVGYIGTGVFGLLTIGAGCAAMGFLFSRDSTGASVLSVGALLGLCTAVILGIFFAVLCIALYNIYLRTR